jgi:hypothetical protein
VVEQPLSFYYVDDGNPDVVILRPAT